MQRVLPIVTAELLELYLFRRRLLVLGRRVIPTFALGALEADDFSSCACHSISALFRFWAGALDEI